MALWRGLSDASWLNEETAVRRFLNVAPPAGLEPATYGLTVRRSTD